MNNDKEIISQFFITHKMQNKRVIGIPTSKVHEAYIVWMQDKYERTGKFMYKHPQVRRMFTIYAKDILNVEVVTRRIHGKRERVFWDSGATRLDLGNYLD